MKLIDYDYLTGTQMFYEYNHADDVAVVRTAQDVEPVLERNKALYNEADHRRHGMKESFLHVASIPNAIIEKWMIEDKLSIFRQEDWPAIKRKLNDPDYRFLRTTAGRI